MTNKKGFTLIELLVAVLIVGVLTAIALPQYNRSVERTRVAEALMLMRSIYDSCERLAWEKQYASCTAGIAAGRVNVKKLDITVKGKFINDGLGIETENFKYILSDAADATVTATAKKGAYTNAVITFDGKEFTCGAPDAGANATDAEKEAAKACTVWGSNTWNK